MKSTAILLPMLALAAWTMLVLLLVPYQRIKAARQSLVTPGDFRYGESAKVPPWASLPNRNYMNLLEVPILFYVASLTIYVSGAANVLLLQLAWAYVGLRIIHSLIHLTYNNVLHRLGAFATSNVAL